MLPDEIRATLSDAHVLRCTLEGEVRGEPLIGQIGVGCVILNRLQSGRFGRSLSAVCLAKFQFSCWWGNDANAAHTYALAEQLMVGAVDTNPQMAWVTSGLLLNAIADDPTHGANHYLTTKEFRQSPPPWAKGQAVVAVLGHHIFLHL